MSEQSMAALRTANVVRLKIANLKRNVAKQPTREEALRLVALMLRGAESDALDAIEVADLLEACRGVGARTAEIMLAGVRLRPNRRVGDLTTRQRHVLAMACDQVAECGIRFVDLWGEQVA